MSDLLSSPNFFWVNRLRQDVMNLVAFVNGQTANSVDLSETERDAIRGRGDRPEIRLLCNHDGHLKRSRKGLFFFAHNPGVTPGPQCANRSLRHVELQAEILAICKANGIPARLEVRIRDRIADVHIALGEHQPIVVEIQLSPQNASITKERTAVYQAEGSTSVWIMKNVPADVRDSADALHLTIGDDDALATTGGGRAGRSGRFSITELLRLIAAGHLRFTKEFSVSAEGVTGQILTFPCKSCHQPFDVVFPWASGIRVSRCGVSIPGPEQPWKHVRMEVTRFFGNWAPHSEADLAWLKTQIELPAGSGLKRTAPLNLGVVVPKYVDWPRAGDSDFWAQSATCPTCGAKSGIDQQDSLGHFDFCAVQPLSPPASREGAHWCLPKAGFEPCLVRQPGP